MTERLYLGYAHISRHHWRAPLWERYRKAAAAEVSLQGFNTSISNASQKVINLARRPGYRNLRKRLRESIATILETSHQPKKQHNMVSTDFVLVTGGSGFVASHCIILLLQKGYRVHTTIRSLKRTNDVRKMLKAGGVTNDQADSVEYFAAGLTSDDGWREATQGCTFVLHVASPFPPGAPKHPDDLIVPAREGTLRALRAAKAAGSVKRVVVTSSFAAIGKSESS